MTEEKKALGAQEFLDRKKADDPVFAPYNPSTCRVFYYTYHQMIEFAEAYAASLADSPSPTPHGALWLCYHAVKLSQWEDVNGEEHDCPYCAQHKGVGHHKDCMIGNGLKMMEESIVEANKLADSPSGTAAHALQLAKDAIDFVSDRIPSDENVTDEGHTMMTLSQHLGTLIVASGTAAETKETLQERFERWAESESYNIQRYQGRFNLDYVDGRTNEVWRAYRVGAASGPSVREKEPTETGWLIEKTVDGCSQWLTCAWTFGWTDDAANAIRFCRRDDAEQIASMMENDDIRITEHQWG
jgi:hypothetical protein